jgi:hypothetical protein
METLTCEACAAPIPLSGVDRRFQIATCGHCSAIFDISDEVESGLIFDGPPTGVRVDRENDRWRVSWRRKGEAVTLLLAAF